MLYKFVISGLHFHVVGEGVVRVRSARQERIYDKENYIDFRMRLLGEPGKYFHVIFGYAQYITLN